MRKPNRSAAALLALLMTFSLCACGAFEEPVLPDPPASSAEEPALAPVPPPPPTDEELAAALADTMTLEEQVGQLFFVRCPETDAAAEVSAYHLGGLLLFGRDFKDRTAEEVQSTLASYQDAASIPLLIGADEEGGTVVRVSSNPALADHRFLSPQKLFAQGGLEAVSADAREKSALLRSLGVNVNFAPVADVSTDPGDFIHDRSFGRSAEETADCVRTVVSAMQEPEAVMGSVLKHFPGYGNNVDTHTGIALDQRSLESFKACDLLPFAAGIEAGADSVLVSHNIVSCMDSARPASLSPAVHQLLREEMGFRGVILTDDLAMDAVASYAEDGSVAVLALQAGNDMVVTTDYRTQLPLVIEAAENGVLDREALRGSVIRVLCWKIDLGLLDRAALEDLL